MDASRKKILILDDNSIDRETCRRYLSRSPIHRYDFVEHNAIEGALDLVVQENPECILLDYHLHDGNGVEFIKDLSEIGGTKLYPVVMLTGTGSESIAVTVMKAGAQDYLVKDRLNPEVLLRTVEAAIYKAQTARLLDAQRVEVERLFREAQEANARKDQFLATLSHELRTPLTPVLAAVSNPMLENASVEELRQTFAIIRRNIELEARLIDDMLDLTRIAQGKLEVDVRSVDAHYVLTHAVETCDEDLQSKKLHLTLDFRASRHMVKADAARLQQVFWNLIKNAVKFTPQGGFVSVTTRDRGDDIEIEVADSGLGIEPELLDKIFDAFEQGNTAITKRYGGLGLGLAICKALIEAHSGTIAAKSAGQGQGSQFLIRLAATLPGAERALPVIPVSVDRRANASATLLLVEDHSDTALLLSRIMESQGYHVHVAGTIAEAVAIFDLENIDAVVSDIGLPDGSGTDLMRLLHSRRPVPGIALSGFGMEEDLARSESAGFSQHLTKPIDWSKLSEALKSLLK